MFTPIDQFVIDNQDITQVQPDIASQIVALETSQTGFGSIFYLRALEKVTANDQDPLAVTIEMHVHSSPVFKIRGKWMTTVDDGSNECDLIKAVFRIMHGAVEIKSSCPTDGCGSCNVDPADQITSTSTKCQQF